MSLPYHHLTMQLNKEYISMMKKLAFAVLFVLPVGIVHTTQVSRENTLSAGYAQSNVKFDNYKLNENPKGFNFKYRHEFDNKIGMFGSFTYTRQGYEFYLTNQLISTGDLDYYSFLMGPSWRFNDILSTYVELGIAYEKARIGSTQESKNGITYAMGVQFNLSENWIIDTSYEYSKLNNFKVGTWMTGVGYSF